MPPAVDYDPAQTLPFALDADPLPDILREGQAAIWELLRNGSARERQRMGFSDQAGNTGCPGFARYALPYALTSITPDEAILVNRDYKPVGIGLPYSRWVNYRAFPQWIIRGEQWARLKAAPCWLSGRDYPPSSSNRFMFHDGCPPWASKRDLGNYERRLSVLIDTLATTPVTRDMAGAITPLGQIGLFQ